VGLLLCERCKKVQATFHLTNIDKSGEKVEKHLCDRCAVDEGLLQVHKPPVSAVEILESFVAGAKRGGAAANRVCEQCGISYVEFRNQGLLGCPHDYDAFDELLAPLIERAQDGTAHHTGKAPRSLGAQRTPQQEIARLRRQLNEAIAAEDYERAAGLRDRLKELEAV